MVYWIQLKSGDLQYQLKQPKNRAYVSEHSTRVEEQHLFHTFELYNARGQRAASTVMDTYSGFDRGPKKFSQIKTLFELLLPRICADCRQPIPVGDVLCNCNTSGDLG